MNIRGLVTTISGYWSSIRTGAYSGLRLGIRLQVKQDINTSDHKIKDYTRRNWVRPFERECEILGSRLVLPLCNVDNPKQF